MFFHNMRLFSVLFQFLLVLFLPSCGVSPVWSADSALTVQTTFSSAELSARKQVLQPAMKSLDALNKEVASIQHERDARLAALQHMAVTDTMVEQARLDMESVQVNLQSAALDVEHEKQKIAGLEAAIQGLQQQIDLAGSGKDDKKKRAELSNQLSLAKALLEIEQQYAQVLADYANALKKKAELASSWYQSVQAVYKQQQQVRHQESLDELKRRLQQQEQDARKQTAQLQQELSALSPGDPSNLEKSELIQKRIQALAESLNVLRMQIAVQEIAGEYEGLNLNVQNHLPVAVLRKDLKTLKDLSSRLEPLTTLVSGKLDVLQRQWALLQKQYALKNISVRTFNLEKKILTGLIEQFSTLQNRLQSLDRQLQHDMDRVKQAYSKSVQQSLDARESLPHDLASWKKVFFEFLSTPRQVGQLAVKSTGALKTGWQKAGPGKKILFSATALILLILTLMVGHFARPRHIKYGGELNFSSRVRIIALALLNESRFLLLLSGTLLLAGRIFEVEPLIFRFLVLLVATLVCVQLVIRLSYWVFISPLVPTGERQPRLYRTITWTAIFSALFVLLVGLGNMGLFSPQLRNVIDRLFMLLLLPWVYFFMYLRRVIIARLKPRQRSRFLVHLAVTASISIPLTLFCAALIGLAGYINLAWFVAGQLGVLLSVIFGWIVAHDLAMDWLGAWEQEIRRRQDGDTALLLFSPLRKIIDLMLFLLVLGCMARLYGWGTDSVIANLLKSWLEYPLFHVGTQSITLFSILTSIFVFVVFIYLGSLSKNFTYAWLYKNVKDRGLRNSLSVFTQYAVLVIGILVALNVIGINLTSLTVFAGALGVGIGFGLQNIANNLVSGLILLAERPVRVDDWVTVGDSQGIISRIGLRSLVLRTWDNQDVIIPNSSLITTPVTNWTLSDTILRTVFEVGVRYQDDPHRARDVIYDAVCMVPEVSLENKPRVYLTEFANSSVNFRVEFYSNLSSQHGRGAVKSKVMFAIWDALKDADIGIPFPQQDIYIKEVPIGNTEQAAVFTEQKGPASPVAGSGFNPTSMQ